jgi:hypothetical protein
MSGGTADGDNLLDGVGIFAGGPTIFRDASMNFLDCS